MTVAERLDRFEKNREQNRAARDFALCAKYIALGKDLTEAYNLANTARATPAVTEVLKAAQQAGQMSGTWGDDLAPFSGLADAFMLSLRTRSIFQAMRQYSPEVPFRTKVAVTSTGATSTTINEAMVKPITKLSLTSVNMSQNKSLAIVIATQELLRFGKVGLFQNELERAIAAEVDSTFITKLTTTAGVASSASGGGAQATQILGDVAVALDGLTTDAGSKIFCAVSQATMEDLAFKTDSTGQRAFPTLGINGGTIGDVEFFPTAGVSNSLVLFDAKQIAHCQSALELETAQHASIQLESAPDSPQTASTALIDLWQMNMVGLRATYWWDAQVMRAGAVSVITSINYSANSPA